MSTEETLSSYICISKERPTGFLHIQAYSSSSQDLGQQQVHPAGFHLRMGTKASAFDAQVATSDGRLAVFGRDGVVAAAEATNKHATQSLHFLGDWGGILRITSVGFKLTAVSGGSLIYSLPVSSMLTIKWLGSGYQLLGHIGGA